MGEAELFFEEPVPIRIEQTLGFFRIALGSVRNANFDSESINMLTTVGTCLSPCTSASTRVKHHLCLPVVQVNSKSECLRACTVDNDFVCRSVLYKPSQDGAMQGSCSVFHVDHMMLPGGAATFSLPSPPLPLLDTGETKGIYLESRCTSGYHFQSLP